MLRNHLIGLGVCAGLAAGASAATLDANPGPANNGGSSGWAMFFDLQALSSNLFVTHLTTASTATAGSAFQIEIFTRSGSALGGPASSGPGSSPAGWTSLGVANATQGGTSSGVSLQIDIPDISLTTGQVTGVALLFSGAGPRYFGQGTPPYDVYNDGMLMLTTGDGRSAPFTTGGSFFSSRALVGSLTYEIPTPGAAALLGIAGLTGIRRRR